MPHGTEKWEMATIESDENMIDDSERQVKKERNPELCKRKL